MKFCQTVVLVMLSIMYSATIFGVKETKKTALSDLPEVLLEHIEEFSEKSKQKLIYEQTGHVKPYPSFLRKSSSHIHEHGLGNSLLGGGFLIAGMSLAFWKISALLKQSGLAKRIKWTKVLPVASFASLYLFKRIIGRLSEPSSNYYYSLFPNSPEFYDQLPGSYTCMKGYPPEEVDIHESTFFVRGTLPISRSSNGIRYYCAERRSLSNMKLLGREVVAQGFIVSIEDYSKPVLKFNRGWIYKLKDGRLDIYRSRTDFKLSKNQIRLPMKESIIEFDFDIFNKIIITTSKEGIRKWELKPEPVKIETMFGRGIGLKKILEKE